MSGPNEQPPPDFGNVASAPLVGQPVEVGGWTLTMAIVCRCSVHRPLQLTLASREDPSKLGAAPVVTCPNCGKNWRLGPKTRVNADLQLMSMLTDPGRSL